MHVVTAGKHCAAATIDHASYDKTEAGVTAAGSCDALYVQSPRPLRKCLLSGEWSEEVTNPCVRTRLGRRLRKVSRIALRLTRRPWVSLLGMIIISPDVPGPGQL